VGGESYYGTFTFLAYASTGRGGLGVSCNDGALSIALFFSPHSMSELGGGGGVLLDCMAGS
jgi:hypothetical protein